MRVVFKKSAFLVYTLFLFSSLYLEAQVTWNCIDEPESTQSICTNNDNQVVTLDSMDENVSFKYLGENFVANYDGEEFTGEIIGINNRYFVTVNEPGYAISKIEIDHQGNYIGNEFERFYEEQSNSNFKYYKGEYKTDDDGNVFLEGNGFAELTFGGTYVGEFKDGEIHGQGEWNYENVRFIGEFQNNLLVNGEAQYDDGSKYIGTFLGTAKHGYGEYFYLDGSRHIGGYQNDSINGMGTYFFNDGSKYVGEFVDGLYHGEGIYYYREDSPYKSFVGKYKNDYTYEGIYTLANGKPDSKGFRNKEGLLHGEGTNYFYNEDGSLYLIVTGTYKNGLCHGICSEIFSDGSSFQGEFVNGNRNGIGLLQLNYITETGYFDENGLQGNGIYKDSKINYEWEGPYNNGLKNGQGIATFLDNGSKFSVTFENDSYIGLEDLTFENLSANKRLALIIGNDEYVSNPLQFAVADSKGIAIALEDAGFEVTHITNTTQEDFLNALYNFKRKIILSGKNTDVLFFYAGHASQVRGINYLNPVDTVINRESQLEIKSININRVFEVLNESVDGVKIAVLDACRNNPFASSLRSAKSGLAQMNAPPGTIIAYSTAPGETAIDGSSGGLGIYTGSLISSIRKSDIKIEEVFKETRKTVVNITQGQQIPWESSSLISDFYFNKEK